LYDLGSFQIATGGNTGTGILGELWCTFEVVLCKPKLMSAIGYELLSDHWNLKTVTNGNPLGTGSVLQAGSNLGTVITSNHIITFPPDFTDGTFLISYSVIGGSTALTAPSRTATNATILQVWQNDGSTFVDNTGSTSAAYILNVIVQITAGSAAYNVGTSGTLPTAITSGDLWVTQINGAIIS